MNGEEFEKVFDWIMGQSRQVLVEKAAQYAKNNDRLHNFKRAAAMTGETPEQALWGFLVKHIISIQDMVQADAPFDDAIWDEKIGDALNYLILLRAIVLEEDRYTSSEANVVDSTNIPHIATPSAGLPDVDLGNH